MNGKKVLKGLIALMVIASVIRKAGQQARHMGARGRDSARGGIAHVGRGPRSVKTSEV